MCQFSSVLKKSHKVSLHLQKSTICKKTHCFLYKTGKKLTVLSVVTKFTSAQSIQSFNTKEFWYFEPLSTMTKGMETLAFRSFQPSAQASTSWAMPGILKKRKDIILFYKRPNEVEYCRLLWTILGVTTGTQWLWLNTKVSITSAEWWA